jgi:hypothetical protein
MHVGRLVGRGEVGAFGEGDGDAPAGIYRQSGERQWRTGLEPGAQGADAGNREAR